MHNGLQFWLPPLCCWESYREANPRYSRKDVPFAGKCLLGHTIEIRCIILLTSSRIAEARQTDTVSDRSDLHGKEIHA